MSATSTERLDEWLDALASAAPAPGGGAAAALSASVGASLICMACNLTLGKTQYAAHEAELKEALRRAEQLRKAALQLADEDAQAFAAVIEAYRLPRATERDAMARSEAIQKATIAAAQVPLRTAELAGEIIDLSGAICGAANPKVLSDIAAAAISARAALEASVVNVEINRAAITDRATQRALTEALERHTPFLARAAAVVQAVREHIAR